MKEEDELLRKCGTKNPFTVPEGYFGICVTRCRENKKTEDSNYKFVQHKAKSRLND